MVDGHGSCVVVDEGASEFDGSTDVEGKVVDGATVVVVFGVRAVGNCSRLPSIDKVVGAVVVEEGASVDVNDSSSSINTVVEGAAVVEVVVEVVEGEGIDAGLSEEGRVRVVDAVSPVEGGRFSVPVEITSAIIGLEAVKVGDGTVDEGKGIDVGEGEEETDMIAWSSSSSSASRALRSSSSDRKGERLIVVELSTDPS